MNSSFSSSSQFSSTHFLELEKDLEHNKQFVAFKTYILIYHTPEVVRILLEEDRNLYYALTIDGTDFLEKNMTIADELFFESEETLKVADIALSLAIFDVYQRHSLQKHMCIKTRVHVRLCRLPVCSEVWRDRVPKSNDIGTFLAVNGTVIRTCSTKVLKDKTEYICSKCKCVFMVEANFKLHHTFNVPLRCPVTSKCTSQKFAPVVENMHEHKNCKDYQEIKVQEQVRKLSMGTIPRSIVVIMEDDLVDSCKAGDDVIIIGTVTCRWQPLVQMKQCELELVIKANNVEVCNNAQTVTKGSLEEKRDEFDCFWAAYVDQPLTARNHILMSLCPQVYGLYVVKLAVALALAGGVSRTDSSGSHIRGESHLLMVGDPGTGKSQFLKYAAKIISRSVLTTGIGSSTAGLTVSAIRDGPQWILEAGALVLADGGICCIDEFSGIREHDRSAIHEAMEQQTISVAKAGLVCKLNTRTTILAATNPKLGKYDESSSVGMNVGMASPLLSRFDIVLVLNDTNNSSWDSVVADYLLKSEVGISAAASGQLWTLDQMQTYFSVIREINPVVSSEADQVLKAYYRCHRNSITRNAARTTIRLLESLIRLSEAHARLMFRSTVTVQDAITAITVMESSMQGGSLLPTGNILHSCFPKDPGDEYRKHCDLILELLDLKDLANTCLPSGEATASQPRQPLNLTSDHPFDKDPPPVPDSTTQVQLAFNNRQNPINSSLSRLVHNEPHHPVDGQTGFENSPRLSPSSPINDQQFGCTNLELLEMLNSANGVVEDAPCERTKMPPEPSHCARANAMVKTEASDGWDGARQKLSRFKRVTSCDDAGEDLVGISPKLNDRDKWLSTLGKRPLVTSQPSKEQESKKVSRREGDSSIDYDDFHFSLLSGRDFCSSMRVPVPGCDEKENLSPATSGNPFRLSADDSFEWSATPLAVFSDLAKVRHRDDATPSINVNDFSLSCRDDDDVSPARGVDVACSDSAHSTSQIFTVAASETSEHLQKSVFALDDFDF